MATHPEWPLEPPIYASGATSAQDHLDWCRYMGDMARGLHIMAIHINPGDGVWARGASPYPGLLAHEQSTPSMKIEVDEGMCNQDDGVYLLRTKWASDILVAPVTDPRIDIIEVNPIGQVLQVTAGTEAGSPSAPSVTSGYFKLAEIYHRVGEVSIKDASDGSNGYITDSRTYCNA